MTSVVHRDMTELAPSTLPLPPPPSPPSHPPILSPHPISH